MIRFVDEEPLILHNLSGGRSRSSSRPAARLDLVAVAKSVRRVAADRILA